MDFRNTEYLRQYIKEHISEAAKLGQNEAGEVTQVSITPASVDIETFQNNGRTRHNTFWIDGTVEEWFET